MRLIHLERSAWSPNARTVANVPGNNGIVKYRNLSDRLTESKTPVSVPPIKTAQRNLRERTAAKIVNRSSAATEISVSKQNRL
jgi:hypothetical protein